MEMNKIQKPQNCTDSFLDFNGIYISFERRLQNYRRPINKNLTKNTWVNEPLITAEIQQGLGNKVKSVV